MSDKCPDKFPPEIELDIELEIKLEIELKGKKRHIIRQFQDNKRTLSDKRLEIRDRVIYMLVLVIK